MTSLATESIRIASALLRSGQPMAALQIVGGQNGPDATALRGIARAQLGDFDGAIAALRLAAQDFAAAGLYPKVAKAQAALAEIAFASRDLTTAEAALQPEALDAAGDPVSAAYVRIQRARLLTMTGRRGEADAQLAAFVGEPAPEAAVIARAELAINDGRFAAAGAILAAPLTNPLLAGECRRLAAALTEPAFDLVCAGEARAVCLLEIETLRGPYVDVLRRRFGAASLARRGGQLELLCALARGRVSATSHFGRTSESLAVRLRMEISRLREDPGIRIEATGAGYVAPGLRALMARAAPLQALMADGEAWTARALAAVLGVTPRTVERQLADLPGIVAHGQHSPRRFSLRGGHLPLATQLLLRARDAAVIA